jgi:GT2 family glycosyltransferase
MNSSVTPEAYPCKTAVVILGWNGISLLQQFLPSVVLYSSLPDVTLVYVDNHSTDESVQWVRDNFPLVRIIQLPHNLGFAGGYNEALREVKAQYYVLLNQDVEVTEHWLSPVVELLDNNLSVWAAQPKVLAWNDKTKFEYAGAAGGMLDWLGYPFCRGRLFHITESDEGQYNSSEPIFWASGAVLFIRADTFHSLGGFDTSFFAHQEEIDLCWRIQKEGGIIMYVPKARVYHLGGGSLDMESPRKTFLNFRNNLLMLLHNLPIGQLIIVLFLRFFLDLLAAAVFLLKRQPAKTHAVVKAYLEFVRKIPAHCKKRTKAKKRVPLYPRSLLWEFYVKKRQRFTDWKQV